MACRQASFQAKSLLYLQRQVKEGEAWRVEAPRSVDQPQVSCQVFPAEPFQETLRTSTSWVGIMHWIATGPQLARYGLAVCCPFHFITVLIFPKRDSTVTSVGSVSSSHVPSTQPILASGVGAVIEDCDPSECDQPTTARATAPRERIPFPTLSYLGSLIVLVQRYFAVKLRDFRDKLW